MAVNPDDKKPRFRRGPFGEAVFPGAEADLTMPTVVRYVTKADVPEIARFYEAVYGDARPHIQMVQEDDNGLPVFTLGVGPKYRGEGDFGAIVAMTDPATLKKRRQLRHILITSRSGYEK
ncbi:MAG: hypothetical protein ACI9OJ_001083 [Myxococcota bacterium]